MLAVSNAFDVRLIAEQVVIGQAPAWPAQPAPSFNAGVVGSYQLQAFDPEGGVITYTWAPDSGPRPSWLSIAGDRLAANGTQSGAIVENLKLRATDAEGLFTDSQFFSVTSIGWTTIPAISFTQGEASSVDISLYYIGYDPTTRTIQVAAGSLDGVTFEEPNLIYDGVGAVGTATFQFEDTSKIGGQAGISTIAPLNEDRNSDGAVNAGALLWGPWRSDYSRRLYLQWRRGTLSSGNRIGDWLDKNQVQQGTTPWSSLSVTKGSVPKKVSIDVTDLVKYWHANGRNKGFFITTTSGTAQFGSRNHATASYHPLLTVVGSNGAIYSIQCTADAHLNKTTSEDMARYASIWCDSTNQSLLLWFPLESVTASGITSATMDLWLFTGGTSTASLRVFEMDGQEMNLCDGVGIPGLAENYPLDVGMENHQAVIDSFDFREAYVNTTSPELKFFQGGTGQAATRVYSFDSELQCNIVTLGVVAGGGIGICNLEYGLFNASDIPNHTNLYARYLVRFNTPWTSTSSKVKMPGFSYRWGHRDSQSVDFSISSGNSGGRPSGLVSPHYEYFAPWVYKVDPVEDRIYTKNGVTLFNEKTTAHPLKVAPEGIQIRPLHFVPFWQTVGLVEGQVYYCRNPRQEGGSGGVEMSFQVSATPTGAILPLANPNVNFDNVIPAVGFDDPGKWEIWRHGGSMRSQVGYPDPRPSNPYGQLMEMHSLINYPAMPSLVSGQQEPEFHWDFNDLQAVVRSGQWYNIEHHCKMNTVSYPIRPDMFGGGVGNFDGLYEVFINGQQVFKWENVCFINHPSCSIQSFWFDIFHGGTLSTSRPNADMTISLGRFAVATQYIGPIRK